MKRRELLKSAAALSLIPLVNVPVRAAEKMPLDDPAAVALKYVEDATTADRADKMNVAGSDQFCDNCRFYVNPADGWGGCMLFQNRLVPAKGWCAGWVPTA